MGFLRTLFWIAVTVIVVVFSLNNWTTVTLDLFGGLQADAKLPVLLLIAFLVGFVPLYIYHRVVRWQDRSRPAETPRMILPAEPIATEPTFAPKEPF